MSVPENYKRAIDGPLAEVIVPAAVLDDTRDFLYQCGVEGYEGVPDHDPRVVAADADAGPGGSNDSVESPP